MINGQGLEIPSCRGFAGSNPPRCTMVIFKEVAMRHSCFGKCCHYWKFGSSYLGHSLCCADYDETGCVRIQVYSDEDVVSCVFEKPFLGLVCSASSMPLRDHIISSKLFLPYNDTFLYLISRERRNCETFSFLTLQRPSVV